MIKFINDGEIDDLKQGFYNSLALKKINILDIKDSFKSSLNLKSANKLYNFLSEFKFPSVISYFSATIVEQFYESNWISEEEYITINNAFFKDNEYSDEYMDYSQDRYEFILDFLRKVASENEIKLHIENYKDIFFSDECIDLNLFGDIRNSLRSYIDSSEDIANYSKEKWEEEYYDLFEDNATCFVFEEYEMSKNEISLLQKRFSNQNAAIVSEVYTRNGNTYITISDMEVYIGLRCDFLVFLMLILKGKN
ncbi:hypothetical protein OD350_29330 (plasmid) [Clostridium beijerinckii]|uniref:hypothetical protein n=1 Tax=Clostridium beijerinckii TaxID=1520 RepID=UPI002225FBC5|nr:hypothetical protein [Clostridium beijerinckii]UYZ38992.1 hypothetical protein OD350_29330 [Clostridium beijerinckii]